MSFFSKNPDDFLTDRERTGAGRASGARPKSKSRRARSRQLLAISLRLIKLDRRMLVFPAISAVAGVISGFVVYAVFFGGGADGAGAPHLLVPMLIASAPLTFITITCGVGTASLVADLLDGREPSLARAWALIKERAPIIVAWTLVMWTVGATLRVLQERVPLGGKIAALFMEIGWAVATIFAIPVLAFEGRGPRDTFKRSAAITGQRFGTAIGGGMAIGAGSIVASIPAVVLFYTGLTAHGAASTVLVGLAIGWILAVTSFFTSLDYVFRTVLYRNAVGLPIDASGLGPDDLDMALLRGA